MNEALIFGASHARDLAKRAKYEHFDTELTATFRLIKMNAEKGERFLSVSGHLHHSICQEIEKLGYLVSKTMDGNMAFTTISW